ncbi:MAG: sterol desaturase family protein [Saprospiraceae bacterium]|nr:sterol desaturase family protein [Saprospiraceae bacterium]
MDSIIHYSIPGFILLLLAEAALAWRRRADWYEAKDTFSSLAMGIGNVLIGLVTKSMVFGSMVFVYQYRLLEWGFVWWAWVAAFFAEDLTYYWYHRISHSSRYFWASHVIHHSSQHYNLGTALRQTWTGELSGGFVFWLWLPLVGFHPAMIFTLKAISLLYQFWIHTEAIGKLPRWAEFLWNTPSHHRVHHSSDPKYLDRNHGRILIIWDRLFGTFQVEEEHPHYGLTKNIHTYNPLLIATHEWIAMFKDVFHSRNLRQALGYLFGPPGWSHDGSRQTSEQIRAAWKGRERGGGGGEGVIFDF